MIISQAHLAIEPNLSKLIGAEMRGKRMGENLVEKEVGEKVLKKIEISWGDLKSFEYYIMFSLCLFICTLVSDKCTWDKLKKENLYSLSYKKTDLIHKTLCSRKAQSYQRYSFLWPNIDQYLEKERHILPAWIFNKAELVWFLCILSFV